MAAAIGSAFRSVVSAGSSAGSLVASILGPIDSAAKAIGSITTTTTTTGKLAVTVGYYGLTATYNVGILVAAIVIGVVLSMYFVVYAIYLASGPLASLGANGESADNIATALLWFWIDKNTQSYHVAFIAVSIIVRLPLLLIFLLW